MTSNNYYQKALQNFGKRKDASSKENLSSIGDKIVDTSKNELINNSSLTSKSFYSSHKSKRQLKLMRKDHFESLKSFLNESLNLQYSTRVEYAQIIADFLKFSPECDIEDYERYLKFKSGYNDKENNEEFKISGTFIKHQIIIKKYLEHVHQQKVTPIMVEHYKKPININVYPYPKVTKEDIYGYYQKLVENEAFEDAVMLHTMYSLGLEPYRLCLLTFESLKDNKTIKVFDHKSRIKIELKVTDELYNEFLYLKNLKSAKKELNSLEERFSLDGSTIKGTFIFKTSPTGVYNKFQRKFGGVLKELEATPKDIIILSKYMARSKESRFSRF